MSALIIPKVRGSVEQTLQNLFLPATSYTLTYTDVDGDPLPLGFKLVLLPVTFFVDIMTLAIRILLSPSLFFQKTGNMELVEHYRNTDAAITSDIRVVFSCAVVTEGTEKIFYDVPAAIASLPAVSAIFPDARVTDGIDRNHKCEGSMSVTFTLDPVSLYSECDQPRAYIQHGSWSSEITPTDVVLAENPGVQLEGDLVDLPFDLIEQTILALPSAAAQN